MIRISKAFVLILLVSCASTPDPRHPPPQGVVGTAKSHPDPVFPDYAAGALVYSAVRTASDRDYLKSPFARGTCSIRPDPGMNVVIPCRGISVLLKDGGGKVVGRAIVDDGVFEIFVPPDAEAFVDVESSRYRAAGSAPQRVRRGESLSLVLLPAKSDRRTSP